MTFLANHHKIHAPIKTLGELYENKPAASRYKGRGIRQQLENEFLEKLGVIDIEQRCLILQKIRRISNSELKSYLNQ